MLKLDFSLENQVKSKERSSLMLPIVILAFLSLILCALLIAIPYFFAPKSSSPDKKTSYECGVPSKKASSSRVSVKFFLTAILFILFDVEIIFLYPFAVAYRQIIKSPEAPLILSGMALFLILFIYGLWWEIKSKALDWK